METNKDDYEAGVDQNQGVVGTMARNQQHGDTEAEGTQAPDLDPNRVTDQSADAPEKQVSAPETDTIGEQPYINDETVE